MKPCLKHSHHSWELQGYCVECWAERKKKIKKTITPLIITALLYYVSKPLSAGFVLGYAGDHAYSFWKNRKKQKPQVPSVIEQAQKIMQENKQTPQEPIIEKYY